MRRGRGVTPLVSPCCGAPPVPHPPIFKLGPIGLPYTRSCTNGAVFWDLSIFFLCVWVRAHIPIAQASRTKSAPSLPNCPSGYSPWTMAHSPTAWLTLSSASWQQRGSARTWHQDSNATCIACGTLTPRRNSCLSLTFIPWRGRWARV